ncbi:MAG: hypothetical protein ACT4OZ_15245 [Gemmatimonadota bacterium]
MRNPDIRERFSEALAALVDQVREDKTVLAAILCGSLSHDTVWEKSDVDLVLVTIDDRKAPATSVALDADGVNVHALLIPRASFRATVGGSLRSSFLHSFLAKGRLLYSHDSTIADLWDGMKEMGDRDTQLQLLHSGIHALPCLYKARKWFETRGDLEYSSLWILYSATPLARIEVLEAGELVDREVIIQALKHNPAFFRTIYTDLLNRPKSSEAVSAALSAVEAFIRQKASRLFGAIIDHLIDVGEARSATEIEDHFARNLDVEGVLTACEYLADEGLIGRASAPIQLTKMSKLMVQELAFIAPPPGPNDR